MNYGSKDGLAMLWKEGIKVEVKTYSQDHMDAWVEGGWDGGCWHLTGFYGNPDTVKRPESWAKLKYLKGISSLSWLAIGDFNEITGLMEKERGRARPKRQMEIFTYAIHHCGFQEVDFIGPKFTWLYQQSDGTQIRERLDRALTTKEWMDLFPTAKLYHLSSLASNHSPLSLHLVQEKKQKKIKKSFRFESMWLKDSRCVDIVKAAWEVGREWLELQPANLDLIVAIRNTRVDLNYWLDKEDEMWRQRSRLSWFQEGDRNTSFFHAKASARYQKNYIDCLVDDHGRWQEDEV
ncbi:hypothetical protein SO802_034112 [Lithocarpus litseifolius]|uniref:Reverse transcriptase n=1 Tax=Lithocarpus litseifolius TaxID=425828 RepID=A0AAW2BH90_9ROSI